MENNTEAKVKELVTDFKLDEALDLLIAQAQHQTQRKQNALLVLKGKLATLEEQRLTGMLAADDLARQKAAIAHQILDIADGSPLDHELPQPKPEQVLVQKTVNVPTSGGGGVGKYLFMGGLVLAALVAGFFFAKSCGNDVTSPPTAEDRSRQPDTEQADEAATKEKGGSPAPGGAIKLQNFPSLKSPFNFLDFIVEFAWVNAEWISDTEIRLKMRYYLTCKSNLGICYREKIRLYADSQPIEPAEQSDLSGWVAQGGTISNDVSFVFPAGTKVFEIELARDKSSWKRPFMVLVE